MTLLEKNELDNIKWDIIGLGEVRPKGEALYDLQSRNTICYRGKERGGASGVGFILRKYLTANVLSSSDRVEQMIVKLSNQQKPRIIQIYMPTTSHIDDAIDEVYEEIDGLLNQDKASHTIIMGDFNAKVRAGEQVFGIGVRNDRGDKLVDFAVNKGFRIMNTFFKKKPSMNWSK
ncbi:craniofacial development protein 2-like [Amphiura filiformis]|uniref:craniofacial development protein 2-like n=1 Tax=Amphiura filiformis TaxID=82378 RepID=UPI003B21BB50